MKVPFHIPFLTGKALDYVRQAVAEGHLSGDGPFSKLCHQWLESRLGTPKALLTTSCTHALELSALLCPIQPGDEIILPSFTFPSTANAFLLRGAKPVFVDIRPDTLNMDETLIKGLLSPRTKVIVPVHYGGIACAMEKIMDLSEKHRLFVVEDAAHAFLSRYDGRYLGTIGHLGCLSFHQSKNISCGEGGAILLNCDVFRERAEILREKGTDRSRFLRGETSKYTWIAVGSSYLPSDILAALLYAQLEMTKTLQSRRLALYERYFEELVSLQEEGFLRLPHVPSNCQPNAHLFYVLLNTYAVRERLRSYLRDRGIEANFHFLPLHSSPMGRSFGYQKGDLPMTEDVSRRLLRLPLFEEMTLEEQEWVVQSIRRFFLGKGRRKIAENVKGQACSKNMGRSGIGRN